MLTPDIIADVKFYSAENNGRKMPTPPDYFGCIFLVNGSNHDGRLLLDGIGSIFPGEFKSNIPIKFLCSDLVVPKLTIGSEFLLKEGRIIGEGKIVKIINTEPK